MVKQNHQVPYTAYKKVQMTPSTVMHQAREAYFNLLGRTFLASVSQRLYHRMKQELTERKLKLMRHSLCNCRKFVNSEVDEKRRMCS